MKKVLFFSFIFLFFVACSANDTEANIDDPQGQTDNNDGDGNDGTDDNGDSNSDQDVIIGTWTLYLGTDKREVDDCLKKSTYVFKDDQTYTFTAYNIVNNECIEIVDESNRGEWKNQNNGKYNIKFHGFTGNGQDIPFSFENDNNNMILVNRTYKRN